MKCRLFLSIVLMGCMLTISLLHTGCEHDDSSHGSYDLTGLWNDVAGDGSSTIIMLIQSGTRVTGILSDSSGWTGTIEGTINGGTVSLTYAYSDGYVVYNEAECDGTFMSGIFYSADSSRRGTWSAARDVDVQSGSGMIYGNVLSADTGVCIYGPVNMRVTAGADGTFSASGLPAGIYYLAVGCEDQMSTYHGSEGQMLPISVTEDGPVQLADIMVSGGSVSVGNMADTEERSASGDAEKSKAASITPPPVDQGPFMLSGTITYSDGPAANVPMGLGRDGPTPVISNITTGVDGSYTFGPLDPGSYVLRYDDAADMYRDDGDGIDLADDTTHDMRIYKRMTLLPPNGTVIASAPLTWSWSGVAEAQTYDFSFTATGAGGTSYSELNSTATSYTVAAALRTDLSYSLSVTAYDGSGNRIAYELSEVFYVP
jgi:hypothetical protein